MNGIELAARYGFPPNSLGYCGESAFREALRSHMSGKNNLAALESGLKKFKAHYAYLCLIARENGREPFDPEVVEAFWIGNPLLDEVSHEALRSFITTDLFAGKNKARAMKLAESLPKGAIPHHSFNSLYVNFVTDSVERSIKSFDSCCITWGAVQSISGVSATIMRNSISLRGGKFVIEPRKSEISLESCGMRFVDTPSKGDILSVHWGMAIERLSPKRVHALERYTKMNIEACNGNPV
jgi:hypothetical protein